MRSSIRISTFFAVLPLLFLFGCSDDDGPTRVPAGDETAEMSARIIYPGLDTREATRVPPTVTIGFEGYDADDPDRLPARYRMLLIEAVWEGTTILVKDQYDRYHEDLVAWDSPEWSEWYDYPAEADDRFVTFPMLEIGEFLLFVVQVMDDRGNVSAGRDYGVEVMHMFAARGFD